MKTWHYNRIYIMPIGYTVMIRSAGAKFPPEYSDRNLIVKTQCVKLMWLSGNCRTSPVVSVSSKTQLARLIHSLLQQLLQHSTEVAVFLMSCFCYTCHRSSFHKIRLNSLFHLTRNSLRMSVLNSSYDNFIGIMGFRTVKL